MTLAWHAFTPSKFGNSRLQIKDIKSNIDAMKRILKDLPAAIM
jgi:hypothetical protein